MQRKQTPKEGSFSLDSYLVHGLAMCADLRLFLELIRNEQVVMFVVRDQTVVVSKLTNLQLRTGDFSLVIMDLSESPRLVDEWTWIARSYIENFGFVKNIELVFDKAAAVLVLA